MILVTLVMRNGVPISVGVGRYCFSLENNQVSDNEASRIGSELRGPQTLMEYKEAFDIACLAWGIQEFDTVEEH